MSGTVGTVRLTRRGRALLVAVATLACVGGGALIGGAASAGAGPGLRQVTVRPGETLWQLAGRVAPGSDPRVVVAQIEALNHLAGDTVDAGQRLLLP